MRRVTVPVGHKCYGSRAAGVSLRCEDCGRLRYSTQSEIHRASRMRCRHCGGFLFESRAELKRQDQRAEARYGRASPFLPEKLGKPHVCSCGERFRSPVALQLHREERHGAPRRTVGDPS